MSLVLVSSSAYRLLLSNSKALLLVRLINIKMIALFRFKTLLLTLTRNLLVSYEMVQSHQPKQNICQIIIPTF